MSALGSVLLLLYAAVNAFGAWAVIRRRSGTAKGFMAASAVLVIAAVAVAFGHPAAVALATAGVVGASWVAYSDARAVGRVVPWRQALRAAAGALLLALVLVARPL